MRCTRDATGSRVAQPEILVGGEPFQVDNRLLGARERLDLRTHLDLVSSHMAVVRETADHKEGVQAFKDKRPPQFTGR